MDLPINREEFDEIVDALCSEHWDWNKREFRDKLYQKMKLVKEVMDENPNGPIKKILREQHNLTFHSKAASDFQFTYTDILGNTIEYPIFMSPEMEGTLMLFPSTLHHQVYPFYNTEEPRISISGNLLWNVVEL